MTIEEVDLKIKECEQKLRDVEPIAKRLELLKSSHRRLLSQAFVKSQNIQKKDIEFSVGPDKPWFGNATTFSVWLGKQPANNRKPWTEWNGILHRVPEFIAGEFIPTCGYVDDVKD